MNALEKMFPSLTLFSDLNWEEVTQEYETHYIDISFPEYLQLKTEEGDCPPYLFELAYYELALFDVRNSAESFPHQKGIYLNPTSLFLSLAFDVKRMLEEAAKGNIGIFEREHVIGLFRDTHDKVQVMELTNEALELLQQLEDGPLEDKTKLTLSSEALYDELRRVGIILEIK